MAGIALAAVAIFLAFEIVNVSGFGIDAENPPKVMTTNIVEPSQLTEVSKFRSAAGHSFAGRGESCSSMKHYFVTTHDANAFAGRLASGGHLDPDGKNDLLIRAPFDGMVTQRMKNPLSGELFAIASSKNHGMVLMLDHVFVEKGLHSGPIPYLYLLGSKVKAGQVVARINSNSEFDVEFRVGGPPWSDNWSSYFLGLTDQAYAPWEQLTGKPRNFFINSKEARINHPYQCKDESDSNSDFVSPATAADTDSFVILKKAELQEVVTIGNGDVCDAAHIGTTKKNSSGSFICKKAPDGKIVWNPLS